MKNTPSNHKNVISNTMKELLTHKDKEVAFIAKKFCEN